MDFPEEIKQTKFSNLDRVLQEKILGMKNIVFQGDITSLKELLTPSTNVDYDDIIDADLLSKLANNENISVGVAVSPVSEHVSACYVHRTYNYTSVASEDDMCTLDCDFKNDNITIWNFPGNGKSTALQSMAVTLKKKYPSIWVIQLYLNNYIDILAKFKQNKRRLVTALDLLNAREESQIKSELEKKIFLIPYKVVLMIDGVDEVSSVYTNIVKNVIRDSKEKLNFTKIYVASSEKVDDLLQTELWTYNRLKPLSHEDQIHILVKCWRQKLDIPEENCKYFAEKLVLEKWPLKNKESCIGIPLQLRILAEIFCRRIYLESETTDWKDYYEYINSGSQFNLVRLYELFVQISLFGDKSLKEVLALEDEEYTAYFYSLALENILTTDQCQLFDSYKNRPKQISQDFETKLINSRIIKKVGNNIRFFHGTLVDYFLARCIITELNQTKKRRFLIFLMDEVMVDNGYALVRTFLDEIMEADLDCIPHETLQRIGQVVSQSNAPVLQTLAKNGFLNILKFIFKCSELAGEKLDLDILRSDEETLLQMAIFEGHSKVTQYLVEQGASVHSRNNQDSSALHCAAKKSNLNMVEFLLQRGAEIDCRDRFGSTPLHDAVTYGSSEVMKYLITHGAAVDSTDRYGRTPLQYASERGHLDKVKYLVEKGADVDTSQGAALREATKKGFFTIVKYLVQNGADITLRNKEAGSVLHRFCKRRRFGYRKQKTVEDGAEEQDTCNVFKFLIKQGVDINSVNSHDQNVLESLTIEDEILDLVKVLVESGIDVNHVTRYGDTVLDIAIQQSAFEVVKYLVENGGILTHCVDHLRKAVTDGNLPLVKFLLESGADLSIRDDSGKSPLHWALYHNRVDVIKYLINEKLSKSDLNLKTKNGTTPLETAISYCKFDVVQYLVERGARSNRSLELAASKGNLQIFKLLEDSGESIDTLQDAGVNLELLQYVIQKGIDINMPLALYKGASIGDLSVVKYLLSKGVDINNTHGCKYGRAPLHIAAEQGLVHMVSYLTRNGASVDLRDERGETALYKAVNGGHIDVAEILVQRGADVTLPEFRTILQQAIDINRLDQVKFLVEHNVRLQPGQFHKPVVLIPLPGNNTDLAEYLEENHFGSITDMVNKSIEYNRKSLLNSLFYNSRVVEYLLKRSADIEVREFEDYNVLQSAASEGNLKFLKYLVECGADVNATIEDGSTALHKSTDFNVIKYLVGKGADVNARTKEGWSVLHHAVEDTNLDVCKYLVESGARIYSTEEEVRPVAYIAAQDDNLAKFKYLVENGAKLTSISLHNLIPPGNLDLIKYMIENGARVDEKDKDGRNLLYKAVEMRYLDLVKLLVAEGCEVNIKDVNSITLFEHAVAMNDVEIVKYLTKCGAKIQGSNMLHKSVQNTNVEMVKFLLGNAVDVSSVDQAGRTLLHLATNAGSVDMLRILQENGADSCVNVKDRNLRTALHEAVKNEYNLNALRMVKLLVNKGADVNFKDGTGMTALYEVVSRNYLDIAKFLIQKGAKVDTKLNNGRSVLHEAVASSKLLLDLVKLLVGRGADINVRDEDEKTPLTVLAANNSYDYAGIHIETMKFLIENGARVNVSSKNGRTPLHEACTTRNLAKVKLLVEHGAYVGALDGDNQTPLYATLKTSEICTWMDYGIDIAEFLVQNGALLNDQAENETILHEVAAAGDLGLLGFLTKRGFDIRGKTRDGRTVLHEAVSNSKLDMVRFLVRNGLDVNARASNGSTVLSEAVTADRRDVLEYLLRHGADMNGRTGDGRTVLHAAAEKGDLRMVRILVKHGADVNTSVGDGRTVLQIATDNDCADLVAYLRQNKAI